MRAPGEGNQAIRARARCATGSAFELDEGEICEARISESPGCGEAGDTATNDDDRNTGPRVGGDFDVYTIAQAMTKNIRGADNLARGQRRRLLAPARRERKRHPQKCCKNFTPIHRINYLTADS